MPFQSIDPTTGQLLKEYPVMLTSEWQCIIEEAHTAFESWQHVPWAERSKRMHRAGDLLRERKNDYAELMAKEMGKPLVQGRAEAEKCAATCHYYADHAEDFLKDEAAPSDAQKSYVAYKPLGVVLAVMPWNFPFWQVIRFAAPALMAGNAGLLKHASNVTGCALALESIFKDAGFPSQIFRTLLIESGTVSAVIEHSLVRAVTLTGSTPAGRSVAAAAGKVLKKSVLELGGSDPYIILEDADLERAADICASSRLINGGQSCIAAKRFIVIESVKKQFEDLFVTHMKNQKMGSPLDESTTVGPMARPDLREGLHHTVTESLAQGARLLTGGEIPTGPGAFYPPTVLTDVTKTMPAFYEETFGPVAAIISARDEAEAVALANGTEFGLGAAVFTGDQARGERIARDEIQAGSCFVNASVRSDAKLPFGGIKGSGYGRELSSFGIKEFVNIKTVYVGKPLTSKPPRAEE